MKGEIPQRFHIEPDGKPQPIQNRKTLREKLAERRDSERNIRQIELFPPSIAQNQTEELPEGLKNAGFVPLQELTTPGTFQTLMHDARAEKYRINIYGVPYMKASDLTKAATEIDLQLFSEADFSIGTINSTLRACLPDLRLTRAQMEVAQLAVTGLRTKDIASRLNRAFVTVSGILSEIRKVLEPKLATAGIHRVTSYNLRTLTDYAHDGSLAAEKVMNLYYSTDEAVENRLQNRPRIIRPEGINEDEILLKEAVSNNEYNVIKRYHRDLLSVHGIRLFVTPQNLEIARSREHRQRIHTHPHHPEFVRLSHLVSDKKMYNRISRAIQAGKLFGISDENGIFMKEADVSEFLDSYQNTSAT